MSVAETLEAEFSQLRNDLYWKVFDLKDGFVRWGGYDDAYWWNSVSKHDSTRKRTGKVTGRIYEIDFDTGKVFVTEPQALERVDGEGGVTEAEYIECPNCAAGRIYVPAAEYDGCDCCGWSDGMPIRDWSHRRRPDQHGDHRKG